MAFNISELGFVFPNDWKLVRLGDIAKINAGSITKKDKFDFIKYIDISSVSTHSFQKPNVLNFNEAPSRARRKLKDNDFIISTVRPNLRQYAFLDKVEENWIASTGFCVVSADNETLAWYLYSLVTSEIFTNYLVRIADGGAYPAFNPKEIEDAIIPLPNLNDLKIISSLAKDIYHKIQLNTQINQTLEQIAQTIFKSWFIDFDPVHAKANALASGQTAEQATQAAMAVISGKNTQELHRLQTANPEQYQQLWEIAEAFPSGVDEKRVPRGWAVKRIEDVIRKIPTGKKYSQKTAFEVGNIPILDQGKSGVIGYHNDEAGVKASIENPVIVFANHTCYMRLISYDFSAIQNVFAFVGKESNVLWTYLATLGKQEFTEYKGHFPDFLIKEIIVPNNELTELFGVVVKEHFQQIACNDKQNKTLANVRDLLLPKLLSGEV